MVEWSAPALILAHRPHGEQSVLVSALTQHHGRQAGLVRGGKGRAMRGVLQIGNLAQMVWRARLEEHLGTMTAELITPYASMVMASPLRLAALASVCAIVDGILPEREPQPAVYEATLALVEMLSEEGRDSGGDFGGEMGTDSGGDFGGEMGADSGDSGESAWLVALIRWEVAMLAVAGYALDLSRCAVTGAREGLAFVSPRTGVAVTQAGAGIHAHRLLRLPQCLGGIGGGVGGGGGDAGDGGDNNDEGRWGSGDAGNAGGVASSGNTGDRVDAGNADDAADIADGLALTGYFLAKKVFAAHHRPLPHARQRLAELAWRHKGL